MPSRSIHQIDEAEQHQASWFRHLSSGGVLSGAALALLVDLLYCLGAYVGLGLRLPPSTTSVVWPPNSILTTVLLFTPIRRWWIVLLGALPAHLWLTTGVFPGPVVVALFFTNCSEAIIGAGFIRHFSDSPTQFTTLRRVTVFVLGAAVIAPALSSFLDAAVVSFFRAEPYWTVWKVRMLSNMLSALVIIPAGAGLLSTGIRTMRTWSVRQWIETGLIAAGLVVAVLGSTSLRSSSALERLPGTLLVPLLLWTAVRFGPAGAALSLLVTVLSLVGSALVGRGPFDAIPIEQRVPLVQTFLIIAAIPVMCVAALIQELRNAEAAVRSSDATKSAILASLPSHVAVIDRNGHVIAANENWARFADGIGLTPRGTVLAGFDSDPNHASENDATADRRALIGGLRSVIDGRQPEFSMEYAIGTRAPERWFHVTTVPLKRPEGGAVLTHTDVTERHQAEVAAERSREELAHVTRVWTLGELTASLSHQLNQPLTAIAGNAGAGRRLLDSSSQNARELASIFTDISTDAAHAADVIMGVRELLRKGSSEREELDLNEAVSRTIHLVRSESVRRNVTIRLALSPSLAHVVGNRVQLQQVVLNLIVNAIDAASVIDKRQRLVTVRTAPAPPDNVRVSVHDTGAGLPPGIEAQVFEPFYTTKPTGMGMGLAIARSIIEAHDGTIAVDSRSHNGTTFTVTLPRADAPGHVMAGQSRV